MFKDRKDAGAKLGVALEKYRTVRPLVLAIPKGGIDVGIEVARGLDAVFGVIIARKLPFPDNPEAGFGALAENGSLFLQPGSHLLLRPPVIDAIIEQQKREIERRVRLLRKGAPLPEMAGRTAILVDDGIAAGSTMRACIELCREKAVGCVVVAAPVSSPMAKREMARHADAVAILESRPYFRAVAEAYEHWYDVSDDEAVQAIEQQAACSGRGL